MTAKAEHVEPHLKEVPATEHKTLETVRPRRLVIIESPLAGPQRKHAAYVVAAMRDSIARGEAPLASHALYAITGVLDDDVAEERDAGIACGLAWGAKAEATVVCVDLGVSDGMRIGIAVAEKAGRTIEFRSISGWKWPK
jgi:hypothetical protein